MRYCCFYHQYTTAVVPLSNFKIDKGYVRKINESGAYSVCFFCRFPTTCIYFFKCLLSKSKLVLQVVACHQYNYYSKQ